MYEEAVKELEKLAEARGLRVEEGDSEMSEFVLYRGDEPIGSVWYLHDYDAWSSTEPGSEILEHIFEYYDPKPSKPHVFRELNYRVTYSYGRRRAPDERPEGAEEALLEFAVKKAKKFAPGAVKVEVGKKTRKLS